MSELIQRAARSGSGWVPAALSDDEVAEVLAFAKAAERVGHADPTEVDEVLGRGSAAFLRKDYAAAHRIFGALLRPIGEGEIDLGQDELVDEVLGANTGDCATQYVVSAYMLSPPAERADTVRAAIREVAGVGHFWEPIREMERVAVEPLPGLATFLPAWRALITSKLADACKRDGDTEEDRWLREVVQRLEGSDGLAKVAEIDETRRQSSRVVPEPGRRPRLEGRTSSVRGGGQTRHRQRLRARGAAGRRRPRFTGTRSRQSARMARACVARRCEHAAASALAWVSG